MPKNMMDKEVPRKDKDVKRPTFGRAFFIDILHFGIKSPSIAYHRIKIYLCR